MPNGGGLISRAISMDKADAVACTPPHTPHALELINAASLGSRPLSITSYPRNKVAIEFVSTIDFCFKSTVL